MLALPLALVAHSALAFGPPRNGDALLPEDLPLRVEIDVESCPLPEGACLAAAEEAARHWAAVPCIDLEAEVLPGGPATLGDGLSQIGFAPLPPGVPFELRRQGDEIDLIYAAGLPVSAHEAVLAGECENAFDLLALHTLALASLFRLQPPSAFSPARVQDWWALRPCDGTRALVVPPLSPGVLDFPVGLEVACDPSYGGLVLGRAPFDVRCEARGLLVSDPLFDGYDDLDWDLDDGTTSTGFDVAHTFEQGGVVQVSAVGVVDGERCDPLRGGARTSITVCPPLVAGITVDPLDERGVRLRNDASLGPAGCGVQASWTVYEGPDSSGPVAYESEAWEPLLLGPRAGVYTAWVVLEADDGTTSEATRTFEVQRECGCRTSSGSGGLAGAALLMAWLATRSSRRRPRQPRHRQLRPR